MFEEPPDLSPLKYSCSQSSPKMLKPSNSRQNVPILILLTTFFHLLPFHLPPSHLPPLSRIPRSSSTHTSPSFPAYFQTPFQTPSRHAIGLRRCRHRTPKFDSFHITLNEHTPPPTSALILPTVSTFSNIQCSVTHLTQTPSQLF